MWKDRINALVAAGESIDAIALAMGVTPNAVREIIAGRTASPRADAAMRLLQYRPELFVVIAPKAEAA